MKHVTLFSVLCIFLFTAAHAMEHNNAPTPDEKQLVDARIRAFTQNSRVALRNSQERVRPCTPDTLHQEATGLLNNRARLQSVTAARALEDEQRANEEAIARVYEEPLDLDSRAEGARTAATDLEDVCRTLDSVTQRIHRRHQSNETLDQMLDRLRSSTEATERLLDQIKAERHLANSGSTPFPVGNNNNNNNNTPADPQEESAQSMRLAFEHEARMLQEQLIDEPTQAYELLVQFFRKSSKALAVKTQSNGSTPLHEAIMDWSALKRAYDPRQLIALTALLEAGADKDALNASHQSPLALAFESENELLIQLMTTENPTKETLVNLALEHNIQELIDMLVV